MILDQETKRLDVAQYEAYSKPYMVSPSSASFPYRVADDVHSFFVLSILKAASNLVLYAAFFAIYTVSIYLPLSTLDRPQMS